MALKTVRASDCVVDPSLWPRKSVSASNIAALRAAREAGAKLPPIVVDAATMRIVDGVHRREEVLRSDGDDATLRAELREYSSDAELFLDAVRLNAVHGEKLTAYDRAHTAIRAEELGIDPDLVASALSITVDQLGKLTVRKTALDSNGSPVPIKRTIAHLAGRTLSPRQEIGNRRAGGHTLTFYAEQIITAIDHDTVDWQNVSVIEALTRLAAKLADALSDATAA